MFGCRRRELLDRTLVWDQRHLLHALREFETFYNGHRPHQCIANARPPAAPWAAQQARNLATDLRTRMESLRFLLRDRDTKYTKPFDDVFQAEDMNVLLSAPRAPRMNAHCERVIRTIRSEALDHVLIINEAHARRVLAEYQDHYNRHRPHQARAQCPPETAEQPTTPEDLNGRRLLRTRRLGGTINEYRYVA